MAYFYSIIQQQHLILFILSPSPCLFLQSVYSCNYCKKICCQFSITLQIQVGLLFTILFDYHLYSLLSFKHQSWMQPDPKNNFEVKTLLSDEIEGSLVFIHLNWCWRNEACFLTLLIPNIFRLISCLIVCSPVIVKKLNISHPCPLQKKIYPPPPNSVKIALSVVIQAANNFLNRTLPRWTIFPIYIQTRFLGAKAPLGFALVIHSVTNFFEIQQYSSSIK
jgi:hypothetical protein